MPPCPAPDTCWLYLLRHGATDNNRAVPPRLQGRRTDPPLSDEGRQQARRAGAALAAEPIACVYTSPLLRSRQTAEAIALPHALAPLAVDGLIECDVGLWEGMSWEEVQNRDPEAFRRFAENAAENPYLGGESLQSVQVRVIPVLERLMAENLGRVIAVVAHNVVNRCYLAHLLRMPIEHYRRITQDNCGITLLRHSHGETKLVTVNSIAHLGEKKI